MQMSDETLLKRLNSHPALRGRVETMLRVVDDETGNLQEADAAELRLIEEMRRMGQESLQAWADGQVIKASKNAGQQSHTWREGKKNSSGTAHLEKSA
jgi:membrane-bound ClpP family serine protease